MGLFVNETRLLSTYRYLINDKSPQRVAVSNVQQNTWPGYYIVLPPDRIPSATDTGSGQLEEASQETLELRVSRQVTDGLHEDIDLTNFTQRSTSFTLGIELDADFVDLAKTKVTKKIDQVSREWRIPNKGCFLGLRPGRRNSGESEPQKSISKEGRRPVSENDDGAGSALHSGAFWSRQ